MPTRTDLLFDPFGARWTDMRGAALARRARVDAGGDTDDFLVTAFAGLDPRWLAHGSVERTLLRNLGVDRLILAVDPAFDTDEIRAAGGLMARSRP